MLIKMVTPPLCRAVLPFANTLCVGEDKSYFPVNCDSRRIILEKLVMHWAVKMQEDENWRDAQTENIPMSKTTYHTYKSDELPVGAFGQAKKKVMYYLPNERTVWVYYKSTTKVIDATPQAVPLMSLLPVKHQKHADNPAGLNFASHKMLVAQIKTYWGIEGTSWYLQHEGIGQGSPMTLVKDNQDFQAALLQDDKVEETFKHTFRMVDGTVPAVEVLKRFTHAEE